jgi:pimeloyl-ACP methyl ester carboxylesterase
MRLGPAPAALILLLLCPPAVAGAPGCPLSEPVDIPGLTSPAGGGLSGHFRRWLEGNGYGPFDFPRDDIPGGSYGGKGSDQDPVGREPVVFVHGNSDRAAGQNEHPSGWTAVIAEFLRSGYGPAELYATTWGPADPDLAGDQTHSFDKVRRIRAFIEAVLAYTGSERLDLIAHSMGVTLARKAIRGGELDGRDLGPPLTDRVDTFVGIAGANRGLTACFWAVTEPTCSADDGFYPGYPFFFGVSGVSDFLDDLNADPGYEGAYVYSIWSRADRLIGLGNLVYGRYTSRIPGQDGEKVYTSYPYGHFCVRDLSAPVQVEMVRDHRVP